MHFRMRFGPVALQGSFPVGIVWLVRVVSRLTPEENGICSEHSFPPYPIPPKHNG